VCLDSCPNQTFVWDKEEEKLSFEDLHSRLICRKEEIKAKLRSKKDIALAIYVNECARWYFKSVPFLNRCIPQISHHECDYIFGNASWDASYEKKSLGTLYALRV